MGIYRVQVESVGYILADSYEDAYRKARSFASDIVRDDWFAEPEVTGEVTKLSELEAGWDGSCIPYGEDVDERVLAVFLT